MENSTDPSMPRSAELRRRPSETDAKLSELSSLLTSLDEAARADGRSQTSPDNPYQGKLASVRLGVASSLYTALRAKHGPTADHCLRVALGCSSWSLTLDISDAERDLIEIAALLHDVGKIGVPDHVLLKPGKLSGEELLQMEQHRNFSREILMACCPSDELLDIVYYANAWYDGSKHGFDRAGDALPLGSRMIAIVDAFDAMTTDHIYRRAMSRERATAELFEFADSQFDAALVSNFGKLLSNDRVQFGANAARRWLQQICPTSASQFFGLRQAVPRTLDEERPQGDEFHNHLMDNMHDGVAYVDAQLQIMQWNRSCERMTGIAASSVRAKKWSPTLLGMRDERGKAISDKDCPVVNTMQSGIQTLRRVIISSRGEEKVSIDVHISPVLGPDGVPRGATVLLHDASSQITLEERVQTLYEKATRDPLTKCANRAEFDRLLPKFVKTHLDQGVPCGMIICDIDHFKKINDTYGHQAGDEALTCFGSLLRRHARAGDLVARYGGEEFVILCTDCDNATATRRAEELRRNLANEQQSSLSNRSITASFGVTEIQGGDTPETFLRRADRALLQAKDNGRNIVVQLGTGIGVVEQAKKTSWLFSWWQNKPCEQLLERRLVTVVPLTVAAEKLRGFVADHNAEIFMIEGNCASLKIDERCAPLMRRWSDRPVPFLIELTFDEAELPSEARGKGKLPRTMVHVVIRPKRQRDRRRRDAAERAQQLLVSLKSYLMAHDHAGLETECEPQEDRENFLRNAKQILSYWLRK
jgi:diguanylate cyclase (GGDEF)-like protein/PAS domain S-box-containing protein